jgi:4-oxalocrotonate tautomerase
MPYVNVKITNEGVTSKQKTEVIKGVTKLLQDVLGKDPATTFVVIDEVDMENWGIRGEQVSEIRKQATRIKGNNNE